METKQCGTCKQTLPMELFYFLRAARPTFSARYSTECKECKKTRSGKHYDENVIRARAAVKRWFDTSGRFRKYGLSLEGYNAMLAAQGGVCALCKTDKPGGKGKWHIDHVGGSDKRVFIQCKADSVRGILCHNCNVSLGHYEKLIARVGEEMVVSYLKGHKE